MLTYRSKRSFESMTCARVIVNLDGVPGRAACECRVRIVTLIVVPTR